MTTKWATALAAKSRASQSKQELAELLDLLVERFPETQGPKVILEVGVHLGYSLQVWQEAFNHDLLIGIDRDTTQVNREDAGLASSVVLLQADSTSSETLRLVEQTLVDNLVDFLFVDGNHTYAAAKKDFDLYSPLVNPGGVVVFHDTHRLGEEWVNHVETAQVYAELSEQYEHLEIWDGTPTGPGCGILFL
jgi:predicted O-methyltransferase YrrM